MNKGLQRIISSILLVSLFISSTVFADLEVPDMKPYDAVVSNPEGATYLDDETQELATLEYGTKVRVEYEDYYSEDGITYASCFVEGQKNKHFEINVEDLSVVGNQEKRIDDLTDSQQALVLTKKGSVEMKKGPADAYEKTGVSVPSGVAITVYQYSYQDAWVYIDYQGQKGWIKTVSVSILLSPQYPEIKLLTDTTCRNYQKAGSSKKLKEGTSIKEYYETEPGIELFVKEADGTYGVISSENVAVEEKGILEVASEYCNIYESLRLEGGMDQSNIIFSNVAVGTKLSYQYHNPFLDAYYIEYNGIYGWVYGGQNRILIGTKEEKEVADEKNNPLPNGEQERENQSSLEEMDDFAEQKKIVKGAIGICIGLIVMAVFIKIINKKDS